MKTRYANTEICGHARQRQYLNKLAEKEKFIHAFLFSGPENVGKKAIALSFAAGYFCSSPAHSRRDRFGCGLCRECMAINAGRHPDFLLFLGDDGIGIEEIREVKRRLSLSSYYSGGPKGILIDNAHRLSVEAQSALLKVLEEPAGRTMFFLITGQPHLLLDTVRSRALHLSFGRLHDDELAQWLKSRWLESMDQELVLNLATGRPGLAAVFIDNPELLRKSRIELGRLEAFFKKDLADQFLFGEAVAAEGPEAIKKFFQFLIEKLRVEFYGPNQNKDRVTAKLRSLLELYYAMETTNANRRLLVDSAIIAVKDTP